MDFILKYLEWNSKMFLANIANIWTLQFDIWNEMLKCFLTILEICWLYNEIFGMKWWNIFYQYWKYSDFTMKHLELNGDIFFTNIWNILILQWNIWMKWWNISSQYWKYSDFTMEHLEWNGDNFFQLFQIYSLYNEISVIKCWNISCNIGEIFI